MTPEEFAVLDIEHQIKHLLVEAGSDADEIARNLELAGIQGNKSEASSCPLAIYLNTHLAEPVEVQTSWVSLKNEDTAFLTAAAVAFVENFDRGLYPKLVYNFRED